MSTSFGYAVAALFWLAALCILVLHFARRGKQRAIVRLAGFKWTRADFCRGWLITGDTGSGKTRSGITPLLFQIFSNEPTWGGLCIDDKGLYWETLSEMARHFGREDDLILLQVRPDDCPASTWQPRHTYNLTSDRSIPTTPSRKPLSTRHRVSGKRATRASSRTRRKSTLPPHWRRFAKSART